MQPDFEPLLSPVQAAKALGIGAQTVRDALNRAARGARRVEEGPWRGAYRVGSRWKIPAHIIQRRMAREEPAEDFDRLAVLEREVAELKATLGRLAQALTPDEGDTERPPR